MGHIIKSGFGQSKIKSHKVINDSHNPGIIPNYFGKNEHKENIGLSSGTKHTTNPTEGGSAYRGSSRGGASGDGKTPGYSGAGAGVNELSGAHLNTSMRHPQYKK